MFLIIADSFSKWLEVIPMNNASSKSAIKALKHCFMGIFTLLLGICRLLLVNGSLFTIEEFAFFVKTKQWHETHQISTSSPCNQWMCRKSISTFKTMMKKLKDIESMSDRSWTFLFLYCIRTPLSITHKFLAELLMNRKWNNKLNIFNQMWDSSKLGHPRNTQSFEIDEEVWVWNFNLVGKWILGSIAADPVLYEVSTVIWLL